MRHFFSIVLCLSCSAFSFGQKIDKKLQENIQKTIQGFNGDIGIYVKNLRTGKTVSINADTIFPTASIVKIPILIGIMDKIQRGELAYDSNLVYKDSLLYEGVDILGSFKNDEKILLKKVMMQCMSTLAVVKRETKSWKWPIIQFIYMTGLAYIMSLLAYQLFK